MKDAIDHFVDRVVEDPNSAPRWWRRMLVDLARSALTRIGLLRTPLLDAVEPFTELSRCRRGTEASAA